MNENVRQAVGWAIATEGSMSIFRYNRKQKKFKLGFCFLPIVQMANTDMELLESFKTMVDIGKIRTQGKPRKENHHQAWTWYITGATKVLAFLNEILPYLPSSKKAMKALSIIKFCQLRLSHPRTPYTDEEFDIVRQVNKTFNKLSKPDERIS